MYKTNQPDTLIRPGSSWLRVEGTRYIILLCRLGRLWAPALQSWNDTESVVLSGLGVIGVYFKITRWRTGRQGSPSNLASLAHLYTCSSQWTWNHKGQNCSPECLGREWSWSLWKNTELPILTGAAELRWPSACLIPHHSYTHISGPPWLPSPPEWLKIICLLQQRKPLGDG